jgi:hypothetical protein
MSAPEDPTDVFVRFDAASERGLRGAVAASLGRARIKDLDADAIARALLGGGSSSDEAQLIRFAREAIRLPDGFDSPKTVEDAMRVCGVKLQNESEANLLNVFDRRGRSDERSRARPVLAAWVRAEVKAACEGNRLSADRNLRILAKRLADEADRAAAEDREPDLAPVPVTPTYWALHRLYHRG